MMFACLVVAPVQAASVSLLVDPATIDLSPADGFITGTELSPPEPVARCLRSRRPITWSEVLVSIDDEHE